MRLLWTVFMFAGAGLVSAAGCSEDEGGGTGGATASGSPAGTGGVGGVGGEGGSLVCDVDLQTMLGATPECTECVNVECCEQAQAYESAPGKTTFLSLFVCVRGMMRMGTEACSDECSAPFCGSYNLGMQQECGVCLANCCTEFDACISGTAECDACATWATFDEAACCGLPLFRDWYDCVDTHCAAECIQAGWAGWFECGAGGWGGGAAGGNSAGGGGAGGAVGGSGGQGGS